MSLKRQRWELLGGMISYSANDGVVLFWIVWAKVRL